MLLTRTRQFRRTEEQDPAYFTLGGELTARCLTVWARVEEVLRLAMAGANAWHFDLQSREANLNHLASLDRLYLLIFCAGLLLDLFFLH